IRGLVALLPARTTHSHTSLFGNKGTCSPVIFLQPVFCIGIKGAVSYHAQISGCRAGATHVSKTTCNQDALQVFVLNPPTRGIIRKSRCYKSTGAAKYWPIEF